MRGPTCIFWANLTAFSPQTAPGVGDLSSLASIAGVARVTVEPVDVVCGWAMGSVRARFPSVPELRSFDETDDDS